MNFFVKMFSLADRSRKFVILTSINNVNDTGRLKSLVILLTLAHNVYSGVDFHFLGIEMAKTTAFNHIAIPALYQNIYVSPDRPSYMVEIVVNQFCSYIFQSSSQKI